MTSTRADRVYNLLVGVEQFIYLYFISAEWAGAADEGSIHHIVCSASNHKTGRAGNAGFVGIGNILLNTFIVSPGS